MGDFIAAAVLIAIAVLIIRTMVKDRREGKHSCGGNCGACAASCMCRAKLLSAEEMKKNSL